VERGLVVVSVPGDTRCRALAAALERARWAPPIWLPWSTALQHPERLAASGRPGDLLRVESPGADSACWHALARAGGHDGTVPDGEWRPGRAWFAGLAQALSAIDAASAHLAKTHPSAQILAMTDKLACHERLTAADVPTPLTVAAPSAPDALRERLDAEGARAAYVKPRWGSSGAGVLALRRNGAGREHLTTSISLRDGRLINDKRLHVYEDRASIDAVLAPVLADGAVVQRWIPKATALGGPFDFRLLVVDGRVAHRVARVGRGTVTNLHLDGARADADQVLAPFGATVARRLEAACVRAAACFAGHRCVGVDVMIDMRGNPFVLECNAWGDYLPRLLLDGLDSYDVQLSALEVA